MGEDRVTRIFEKINPWTLLLAVVCTVYLFTGERGAGQLFGAMAFTGALVSAVSLFLADRKQGAEGRSWESIGKKAFIFHGIGVFGIIGTLFYLIYSHQYQYHYVWDHSSNELPVHFMISCFWEGQEGSFLLWSFWHVVLGMIILKFTSREWRNIVLSVLSAINLILATMILGIYVPQDIVHVLFGLAVAVPAGYLLWRWYVFGRNKGESGLVEFGAGFLALLTIGLLISESTGFLSLSSGYDLFRPLNWGLLCFLLATIGFGYFGYVRTVKRLSTPGVKRLHAKRMMVAPVILILAIVAMVFELGDWKIGSSPFVMLRDVFPNNEAFLNDPDFVPTNGNGLNPLLQNYWMVIHPPTLFLGFASTAVPFAFVIGGLIRGKYAEWLRPSAAWSLFSVAILGIGIIMGGYWAYETLNFGGYWNWDPVENSSFVPWLMGIASLHAMVAYRKTKLFLKMTMFLVISVFILVLYSTFLTRSGILGDTSVHTFTDLGLSGQLLALLFIFFFGVTMLWLSRWKAMPTFTRDIPLASAEFFLFLGSLTFIFGGVVITIFTSVPVVNKVFQSNFATPTDGPFFYYRWTIYFAVAFGFLSAMGSFLFWRKRGKQSVRTALFRPFLIAIGLATIIVLVLAFSNEQFSFDNKYKEWSELASISGNIFQKIFRYLKVFFFVFADELLLFSALFTVAANVDILVELLRKGRKRLKVTGGALAHTGFGLMLLGIFFSSGYDKVVSKNLHPKELEFFAPEERIDNVLLLRGRPRNILGYQVTYLGRKEAEPPIRDLEIIQEEPSWFKAKFRDKSGDWFSYVFPRVVFLVAGSDSVDVAGVIEWLNDKVEFIKPKHINERTLYKVLFVPRKVDKETQEEILNKDKAFILVPEDERNETMGAISHPDRKIMLEKDLYVNVFGVPEEKDREPEFNIENYELQLGDTIQTSRALIIFEGLGSEPTEGTRYDLIARADLKVITDTRRILEARPMYRLDPRNRVSIKDTYLDEIATSIAFTGVNTANNAIRIQIQEEKNPPQDIIVMKASEKPMINLLWLGTFVLSFGFGVAMFRRIQESRGRRRVSEAVDAEETSEEDSAENLPDEIS